MPADPLQNRLVQPEAVRTASQESQVAAVIGCAQFDAGIRPDGLCFEDVKRHQSVISGLDQQYRNADGSQIAGGRLGAVISGGIAEAERCLLYTSRCV